MITNWRGETQKGHLPPVCSQRIAIILSTEPKIALWIITGLANPFFTSFKTAYSKLNTIYLLTSQPLSTPSSQLQLVIRLSFPQPSLFIFIHLRPFIHSFISFCSLLVSFTSFIFCLTSSFIHFLLRHSFLILLLAHLLSFLFALA